MSIQYSINKYKTKNNSEDITIILPEKFKIVVSFLHDSIHNIETGSVILNAIDRVTNGESELEDVGGEWFSVRVKRDISIAYDAIGEEKGETRESAIPTQDLRELVVAWTKAIDEFHKGKMNQK